MSVRHHGDVEEREITFTSGDVVLSGTVLRPEEARGVAVLVSGSGPIDRNSDHKKLPLHVMGLLAESLAAAGWASLRYDKRGVGDSSGDYWSAGLFDNIADARSAVQRARTLVSGPVAVVGHSEGAVIAADLARDATILDGAVLLAGMAGTGEQTLKYQAVALEPQIPRLVRGLMKAFGTSVSKQQTTQLAKLASSTRDTYRVQLVSKVNAKWFREFLAYDAAVALSAAQVPLLAMTGSKDVQVDPNDLRVMAELAGERITTALLDDVDHILRHEAKDFSSPRAYRTQVARPLDAQVVEHLTSWLATVRP